MLMNQVAVVTGASSGLGKAIALALANQGVKLVLVGRHLETLHALAMQLPTHAHPPKICQVDLTCDDDIQQFTAQLQQEYDRIDMLVHSAGVFSRGTIETTSVATFDWQYRTNVRAPYLLTQSLLPLLKPCRGQVVFINSTAGLIAREGVSQYAATKFALKAIADSLRKEVNGDGIRVVSIYPGRTASPMQEIVHAMERKDYHPERLIQPEEVAAVVLNTLSLPKTIEVMDISVQPLSSNQLRSPE